MILITECVWLFTAFIVGNFVSDLFGANAKIRKSPRGPFLTPGQILHVLEFDRVSGVYMAIATVGIILSFWVAFNSSIEESAWVHTFAFLLSLPALGTGLFAFVALVPRVFSYHENGLKPVVGDLLLILACVGYAASCYFVMVIPEFTARWWSRSYLNLTRNFE